MFLAVIRVEEGVFVNTAIERASADKDIAALKAFQKRKEHRFGAAGPYGISERKSSRGDCRSRTLAVEP